MCLFKEKDMKEKIVDTKTYGKVSVKKDKNYNKIYSFRCKDKDIIIQTGDKERLKVDGHIVSTCYAGMETQLDFLFDICLISFISETID